MGHRESPKFINKLSLVVYSMLKITSNNLLPMIIGFLETLNNNSTVRCGWSWSQENTRYLLHVIKRKNRTIDLFTSKPNKTTDNSNNILKQKLICKTCSGYRRCPT